MPLFVMRMFDMHLGVDIYIAIANYRKDSIHKLDNSR